MANFNKEFWDKQMYDNVIKGPWKPRKENDENRKKVLEDRSFIENICESVMVQLIHTMNENEIDIKDQNFSLEIGFINECVKAMVSRELGYPHPMTRFMQSIVVVTEGEDKARYSHFDTQKLLEVLDNILDDYEDE